MYPVKCCSGNDMIIRKAIMNQKQDLQIISILGQTQIGYTKLFEDYLKHITQILKRIENDEFWEEFK